MTLSTSRLPRRSTRWRLPCVGDVTRHLAWLALSLDNTLPFREAVGDQAEYAHFEQLFIRYQPALLEFLYGMTHDREWAADLLQDTFLSAYTAAKKLATIEYPQAWLYRIATNISLKALQRRNRFMPILLSSLAPDMLPPRDLTMLASEDIAATIAATIAEREAVWGVLGALPPRWRAVLLLQTVAGLSVAEIAAQLHLTEANVRKMLFRAKERYRSLHHQFDAEGGTR